MQKEMLLDQLAISCGCDYLSQLHDILPASLLAENAAVVLKSLDAQDFSDREWRDTARYLSGVEQPEGVSCQQMQSSLLAYLCKSI